ncbi:MAG: hypothetical protein AB7L66_05345 [Gemmatimonadales bacterium]
MSGSGSRKPGSDSGTPPVRSTAAEGREVGRESLAAALEAVQHDFKGARPVQPSAPESAERQQGDKQDLVAAYDRLVEHEATKPRHCEPPPEPLWKRYFKPAVAAACFAATAYLQLARPAWLFPPFQPLVPAATSANVEQLMTAAAMLANRQMQRTGFPIATIEDLGVPLPGVSLIEGGRDTIRLGATVEGVSYLMTAGPDRPLDFRKAAQ